MNRTATLIVLVALLAGAGGYLASRALLPAAAPRAGETTAVGEDYGDIRLRDLEGRERALAEWDGQLRLVNFWASWCAPCIEEMPLLEASRTEYSASGLQIVGIALDEPAPVRAFVRKLGIGYPILIDTPGALDSSVRLGNARGVLPYSVLIGREGRILAQRVGDFDDAAALRAWLAPHLGAQ